MEVIGICGRFIILLVQSKQISRNNSQVGCRANNMLINKTQNSSSCRLCSLFRTIRISYHMYILYNNDIHFLTLWGLLARPSGRFVHFDRYRINTLICTVVVPFGRGTYCIFVIYMKTTRLFDIYIYISIVNNYMISVLLHKASISCKKYISAYVRQQWPDYMRL